jgi:hypothetical protein
LIAKTASPDGQTLSLAMFVRLTLHSVLVRQSCRAIFLLVSKRRTHSVDHHELARFSTSSGSQVEATTLKPRDLIVSRISS